MFEIEIEKGVPQPDAKTGKYPFRQMEVGDSFFAPLGSSDPNPFNTYATAKRIKDGRKYSVRRVDGGIRVWRVK